MEIIQLSGYTLEEKIHIAHQYLTKKAIAESGLEKHPLTFNTELIADITTSYTRESGSTRT